MQTKLIHVYNLLAFNSFFSEAKIFMGNKYPKKDVEHVLQADLTMTTEGPCEAFCLAIPQAYYMEWFMEEGDP